MLCIRCGGVCLPDGFQFPLVQGSKNKIWNQFTEFSPFFKNRSEAPCKPNESNLESFIKALIYGLIGNFQTTWAKLAFNNGTKSLCSANEWWRKFINELFPSHHKVLILLYTVKLSDSFIIFFIQRKSEYVLGGRNDPENIYWLRVGSFCRASATDLALRRWRHLRLAERGCGGESLLNDALKVSFWE